MKENLIIEALKTVLNSDEEFKKFEYWKDNGQKILTLYIEGVLNLDRLEIIHKKLQLLLEDDYLDDDEYLELSTVSHERLIDLNEQAEFNEYVRVYLNNEENITGNLVEVGEDTITIKVNNKGRIKKVILLKNDIEKVLIEDKI